MAVTVFLETFSGPSGQVDVTTRAPDIGVGWIEVEDTAGSLFLWVDNDLDNGGLNTGVSNARILLTATPSPALGGADYDVTFTITRVSGNNDPIFAVARYADTSNYYSAGTDGNLWVIAKTVAGTVTILASTAGSPVVNDVITFELRGSTLRLLNNGVEVLSVSDSALTATGLPGLGFGNAWVASDDANNVWLLDDFTVVDQNAGGGGGGSSWDPSMLPSMGLLGVGR